MINVVLIGIQRSFKVGNFHKLNLSTHLINREPGIVVTRASQAESSILGSRSCVREILSVFPHIYIVRRGNSKKLFINPHMAGSISVFGIARYPDDYCFAIGR